MKYIGKRNERRDINANFNNRRRVQISKCRDVMLPGMNGFEILKKIREQEIRNE